ncbi:MAG: hypothetical protein MUF30_06740 [Burkholderiales bacterium]|jgi:hypothetical protein|nr:hypothetical protein [Burkholderiales bacterium]
MTASVARIAATAVLAATAAMLVSDHEASLVAGFATGRVAYGTSTAAGLFACGFAIVALWLRLPASMAARAGNPLRVALAAAVAGFALHAVLAVQFLVGHAVPPTAFAILVRGGARSFTAWGHSHVGKVGLDALAQLTGLQRDDWDAGGVFVPEVPIWAPDLMAVTWLVLVAALLIGIARWRQVRRPDGRTEAALTIAAIVVAKTLCDGGLAAHGALPALVVVAAVAIAPGRSPFARGVRDVAAWAFIAAVAAEIALAAWTAGGDWPAVGETLGRAALLAALLVRGSRWLPPAFAVFFMTQASVAAQSDLRPLLRPLPPDTVAMRIAVDGATVEPPLAVAGRTPWAVYRALGDDPRKPRRVLIARPVEVATGLREAPLVVDLLTLDGTRGSVQPPADAWHFGRLRMTPPGRMRFDLVLEAPRLPPVVGPMGDAITRANLYVYLDWVALRLRAGGIDAMLLLVPRTGTPLADPPAVPHRAPH